MAKTFSILIAGGLSVFALSGCAGDGYDSGYTSFSVGVASDGYNRPYYGSRRDIDGDGVPNRYDARPRNPYRD